MKNPLNHRPSRRLAAIGAATALLVLAACGGGGDGGGGSGGTGAPAPATPEVDFDAISLNPTTTCDMAGIGAATLTADAPLSIVEVSTGTTTGGGARDRDYCLVKVRVDQAVNIWVSMPTTQWNGRLRAEGNGVYAGNVNVTSDSVRQGFVGVMTDTGHATSPLSGAFGMLSPGNPNVPLQEDFAHRSMHLAAVIGKQLTKAYYEQDPVRSYWYGCSTGGRQGLMMAQRYPEDFDAILAGAPAIHWDRFQAYHIWPQIAMREDAGGPVSLPKQALATNRAVAVCDAADGVSDGVIDDPRTCDYDPTNDLTITNAACADNSCLTPGEASAIKKIWGGARGAGGNLLWPGLERGASLSALAGAFPFPIPVEQARYWVYFDPTWDWNVLDYLNYEAFFSDNIAQVGPRMATDNPDLSAFKARGGKLILYHGWSDNLIMPRGTVNYYERVKATTANASEFSRLYMVGGMGHCSGGTGVDQFGQGSSGNVPMEPKTDVFRALMAWSEKGQAPNEIVASRIAGGVVTRTRPLCPYPQVAKYKGSGSTDEAANFVCAAP
ncbi:MAG: tannase/feruloyl esterase family alpha/beta hydrolase [Hydrogenophaga sp.]|uniref:tannase/feruloyl esterase family alpha/beta hydrolase n=1 Tax=Hydrogenophaga sp. TaxID=1904254 RepID=UPI001692763A|nr:tannase/feruloyl esterase family alpha/beta hydrolase [Hydrogenophaga sp.]NIM39634.1 tannase/feruloyl esterase family alpha/beta hydrolase [Hydrogenophaga sp.]NIN24838.1 tannase/feruloyl esterase family alpha/beta hydrolase [Hydrogenophaga sp.]NIN29350.1 tannase/feruloyl esterase family alpha/beta hydrolase [Hydrogenophaga sp.]NIN53873.1 tannase/feruloyl esterase family alpha/beta hydrolase [Hydrogenophaga sp.]NIO50077.1 tannase/feruloyl esterase family alpha/beta hydrolase [Hydrogenophaga 